MSTHPATDPLSRLVFEAVKAAMEDTGKPLSRRLLDTSQTAEYLGISEDSVRRLHAEGKLKKVGYSDCSVSFATRSPLLK